MHFLHLIDYDCAQVWTTGASFNESGDPKVYHYAFYIRCGLLAVLAADKSVAIHLADKVMAENVECMDRPPVTVVLMSDSFRRMFRHRR